MKTIYFMRHAKSNQTTQCPDFDRPLSKRGERDAILMAKRLTHFKVFPDLIISSPAKRAIKTAKIIAEILKYPKKKILPEKSLYNTSVNEYLKIINKINDENSFVFIFGHNSTITEICEILSNSIIGNIPTMGIFCIAFDVESFKDIVPESGKVVFFDLPKKHYNLSN